MLDSLFKFEKELDLTRETQADVSGLTGWMQSFEFILLTTVWYNILQSINIRSKLVQGSKFTMEEGVQQVKRLLEEIPQLNDSEPNLLMEAKVIAEEVGITTELKRTQKNLKDKTFPR
ncbi:hypothetical protein Y1Q_0018985 [Alligator mississippiensis]|uniref:Uncharacterized protein n=1 Tax=Alligator mississippiensis TaxID=8496 RepID=A0A151M3J7_ALLMI|nr:hypothetical protein Y1Q_0018985 [Alligator mississippiensis]